MHIHSRSTEHRQLRGGLGTLLGRRARLHSFLSGERSSDEMTSSPHCNVVEGFEALTSVSASLQYYDVRACGLVETFVDGRLSLLNLRWRQIPDSTKCDSVIYFPGFVTSLELSVLPVFSTNQI